MFFTLTLMVRVLLRLFLGKERRDRQGWLSWITQSWEDKWSEYEPEVRNCIKRLRGNIFVDVGASRGEYSIGMARHFRRVYAFEPLPENVKWLKQAIVRRKRANITLLPFAVADRTGQAVLHINPKNMYGGSSLLGGGMESNSVVVPTVTLADTLPVGMTINLVKVDVEGAEWLVLKGAEPIMPQIERWMIELHDPVREKELDSYLRQYGYRTSWLRNAASLPHVFARRSE
jgi:FkbM family methyltransferase